MIQVENKTRVGDAFVEVNHWEVLTLPLKFALGASPIPEKLGSFKTKSEALAFARTINKPDLKVMVSWY